MNIINIRNSWEDLIERLQFNFCHLTEQDLNYKEIKEEELIFRLQQKMGNDRKEVIEILNRIQLY